MITTDKVKCGCDEYPECTHVLYWYQGFKFGNAEIIPRLIAVEFRLRVPHNLEETAEMVYPYTRKKDRGTKFSIPNIPISREECEAAIPHLYRMQPNGDFDNGLLVRGGWKEFATDGDVADYYCAVV